MAKQKKGECKMTKQKKASKSKCASKVKKQKGIEQLRKTPILMSFVKKNNGCWDHEAWLDLVENLKAKGYKLDPDQVGLLLEDKKTQYLGNI